MNHDYFVEAISTFVRRTRNVQEKAEEILKNEGALKFAESKLGTLVELIKIYSDLYKEAKVANRKTLEKQLSRLYRVPDIKDAFDDLVDCEKSWNSFLEKIEQEAAMGITLGSKLSPGDIFPNDINVTDVCSGNDDLASQNCRVVLVSFGVQEGAKLWLNEMQTSFPLYLDHPRKIYAALNLPRSIAKVYHNEALSYYGEAQSRGESIPKMFANIEDDPQQLGGDFLLTRRHNQPEFTFIYRSVTSADRPKSADILQILQGLSQSDNNC